ncbi:hypothetical protein CEP54_006029 [Fusarium duplospermum]|uniref:Uncharacterized protein n=1 Tax=Fusarium duplospermum TaxID=1325734 RepID=A0A428Q9C6_9HYPO|nr:hypothetical protein CEP54_006029 [Fusarium duplospermum]
MHDWKVQCIANFDLQKRRLTDAYNNDKLIAVARRRIAQWKTSGSNLDLPNRNVDDIQLLQPDLIRPKIRKPATGITNVADAVDCATLAKKAW